MENMFFCVANEDGGVNVFNSQEVAGNGGHGECVGIAEDGDLVLLGGF